MCYGSGSWCLSTWKVSLVRLRAVETFWEIFRICKTPGFLQHSWRLSIGDSYRKRYHQSSGRDPLRCPHCHHEMDVWKVWHPKYGVVYDELEAMRRGRYASTGRSAAG